MRCIRILALCAAILASQALSQGVHQAAAQAPHISNERPPKTGGSGADNTYSHLAARLDQRIADLEWGGGQLRVLVEDADLPIRAYRLNEMTGFMPGSLMQIVSGAALLDGLGPDFRFSTELQLFGLVENRVLKGGVVIRGTGDPSLGSQRVGRDKLLDPLKAWAKLIRKEGIRSVEGPVIGDDTFFDAAWLAPGTPTDRIGESTYPSVSALNFNHNLIEVDWRASRKEGIPASYTLFPNLPEFVYFTSYVLQRSQVRVPMAYSRVRAGDTLAASGDLELGTRRRDYAAIQNPALYFAAAFKASLAERGVTVSGKPTAVHSDSPGVIAGEPRTLDTLVSPPLGELLGWALRKNSSLEFDTALKALGRRAGGGERAGSFELGTRAMEDFLLRLRTPAGSRLLLDASGRSQLNRITSEQLLSVIRAMRNHPQHEAFEALFPRAGEEHGVLANRFAPKEHEDLFSARRLEERPPIWATVSLLPTQQAAAGWVRTPTGRTLVFVIAIEGANLPETQVRRQLDSLVLEIAAGGAA